MRGLQTEGFTLIELITVMAIFGMISIYVGQLLSLNERAYQNVDQSSESQQNLRAVSTMLERDIRHAGFMVPPIVSACGIDLTNGPDRLYVSDAAAIDPQDDVTSYPGALVGGGVTDPAVGSEVLLPLDTLVIETTPRPAYDTDGNGTNDSDFRVGSGAILADMSDPNRGTACGSVTEVNLGASTIKVLFQAGLDTAGGAPQLIAVPAVEYRVNADQLLWNSNLLAAGIEDLQVAYLFDLDGDNIVDPGEVRGITGAIYDSKDQAGHLLREIRTNLVARTRLEDPDFGSGQLQRTENRSATGIVADGFRRRVLSTRIRLRNGGERMSVM